MWRDLRRLAETDHVMVMECVWGGGGGDKGADVQTRTVFSEFCLQSLWKSVWQVWQVTRTDRDRVTSACLVRERPEAGLLSSKTDELYTEVPVPAMSSGAVYKDMAVMPEINVTRFHFCHFREI